MNARECFNAGELSQAIESIGAEVKSSPADPQKRTFLFELLCFSGELDRAGKQLEVIAQQGADSDVAVQTYRVALQGEAARRHVFSGNGIPGLPKQIPSYTGFHLKAIEFLQKGEHEQARLQLEEASQFYPSLQGRINGQAYTSLSDCDDVLGPFLEALVGPSYSWIPWESIRSVEIAAPKYLRDLVWLPASVELTIGPLGQVFLPCLYPGSYQSSNDQIRLGRLTHWRTDVEGLSLGMGQKLLAVDDRELPIAEVRQIEFDPIELDETSSQ